MYTLSQKSHADQLHSGCHNYDKSHLLWHWRKSLQKRFLNQ